MSISVAKIIKELEDLPPNSVVLVIIDATDYARVSLGIIKYLVNKKRLPGVYITVNRPYNSLIKLLEENEVDTEKLFFIDLISGTVGEKLERKENCLFLTSPRNLTDLTISIDQAMEAIKAEEKFMFLDTLSTLLVYNTSGTIAKFSHYLVGRMKFHNLSGIILCLEKEMGDKLISTISQFCDKTIGKFR